MYVKSIGLLMVVSLVTLAFNSCDKSGNKKEEETNLQEKVDAEKRELLDVIDSLNKKVAELEKIQSADNVVNRNKDSLIIDFKALLASYTRLMNAVKAIDLTNETAEDDLKKIMDEGDSFLSKYNRYSKEKDRFEDLAMRNGELYTTIKEKDDKFQKESENWQKIARQLKKSLDAVTQELNDMKNKYSTLLASNALSQKEKEQMQKDIAEKGKELENIQNKLNEIVDVVPDIQGVRVFIKNETLPVRVRDGNQYKASRVSGVEIELHATAIKSLKTIAVYIQYYIQPKSGAKETLESATDKVVILEGERIQYSRMEEITPGTNPKVTFQLNGQKGEHRIRVFYLSKEPISKYSFTTF